MHDIDSRAWRNHPGGGVAGRVHQEGRRTARRRGEADGVRAAGRTGSGRVHPQGRHQLHAGRAQGEQVLPVRGRQQQRQRPRRDLDVQRHRRAVLHAAACRRRLLQHRQRAQQDVPRRRRPGDRRRRGHAAVPLQRPDRTSNGSSRTAARAACGSSRATAARCWTSRTRTIADGTQVNQWTWKSVSHQEFTLVPVPVAADAGKAGKSGKDGAGGATARARRRRASAPRRRRGVRYCFFR